MTGCATGASRGSRDRSSLVAFRRRSPVPCSWPPAATRAMPARAAAGGPPPAEVGVVTVAPRPVGLRHRTAGPARSVARGAGARARRRHRAASACSAKAATSRPARCCSRSIPRPTRRRSPAPRRRSPGPQANLTQAAAQAERYKPLVEANAISKQDYVNAVAAQKQAEADVAAAKATRADGADQSRLRHGDRADLRPHRPRAGHRRRAGRPGRGDASSPWCSRSIRSTSTSPSRRPTCCSCAARIASGKFKRAGGDDRRACSIVLEDGSDLPASRQAAVLRPDGRPDLGPDHAARRSAEPDRAAAARHVRARAARAGRRRRPASSCRSRR